MVDAELKGASEQSRPGFVIVCPHCGAEYLPSEIFVEDGMLGDASCIVKTSEGRIVRYSGSPYDLSESYICDYCNKGFLVNGKICFSTEKEDDFDEEYERPLYSNRIELQED